MKIKDSGKLATEAEYKETKEGAEIKSRSHSIRSLESLMKYFSIDTEIWEPDKPLINCWEIGCKIAGVILAEPLYQIKTTLRRKKAEIAAKNLLEDFIRDAKKHAPKYPKIARSKKVSKEKHSLFCCLPDAHLSKLCWGKETGGSDYDLKIACKVFLDAVKELGRRASSFDFDEIVFPVGSDFLQTDNSRNETTGGTRVDTDGRWQKAQTAARQVLVESIDYLSAVAPVKVMVISGNHDMEKAFGLGEVLTAWYRNSKDVTVDNSPEPRKYHEYGQCLVMTTHGDKEKATSLPLIAATENPKAWGRTTYREIMIGHTHAKRSDKYRDIEEMNGVRVRVIPSLSPPDSWHNQHGYWNVRAAEAFVYHRKDGCVANFSYNLGIK